MRKEDLPLHSIAVDTWGGFVWVHLDPAEAAPLTDQLAGADTFLSSYPLTDLATTGRNHYPVAATWKAIVENYNECYHCGPVHPELCELVPAFKQGWRGANLRDLVTGQEWQACQLVQRA